MVAYLTDSESHSSSSLESEKAWHLVSILLRLGRPSRPAELAPRCLLFHASPDLIQFLCSIPGSPLFLTEDQFVMISLEVLLSGFSEFASKAISFCVPRISARVSWPKRSWDGSVQTYFRKRKGAQFASFLLPTAKRRLLSLTENEEKEHRSHSLPNAIQSFSSKENSNAGDDMSIDMGILPFNASVKEHALAISGQENVMPRLLPTPASVLSIYRLEDVDNKGATETETRCNAMGSSISFRKSPDDTCFVERRHSFPSTEIDLNKNIMINENLKANELDGELTLFTVAMHESICVPHDTGTFRGNPESCVPLDKTAQIGEVIEAKVTIGNQIKCADKMISSFTDQKADEVEIPVSSLPAEPSSAQRLPMNSFSKQKPLHGNDLAPGLDVPSNPLDENKPFSPSKQRELHKKAEKCIFKKQKSKRSHNNNAPAKEHRADPMSKSNKIFSEPKPLPDFESFFVEEEEGSGGYGTVYRARRRNDGKTFAIKCPHANAHAHHVNNELKMLERFGGRNFVIKFEGSFKSGNSDCFVLEHVEHDRPEVLKREIDASELQWYGYCLFRALASLHKQGIVHRDVKPGNFLFSRKRCKGYLIDFNLAMDLNQKYCTNSKPKTNNNGSFDHVPRPDASTKEAMKVAYSGTVKSVSRKVSRDSPHQTNNVNKRVDAGHFKTNDLGSRIKFRSQGAEVSGVTSAKDVTSTRTPSAERLKEPMPCHGRKALINFVQEALQGPNHEAVSSRSPASQRKRVAAPPGKPEKTLVYLSPMPLHSSGIAVAGGGLLNGRGDRKHKREGPCVGTKGFRAPEVLFKSAHQGPKVDVWSAGVTLLYLMTGRTPFVGDPEQNIKDIAKLRGSEDVWELAKLHNRESSFPADLFDVQSLPSTDLQVWCELNTRRPDFNETAPWSLFDLVDKCLTVNPRVRISADEALCHEFFAPCHEALRKQRLLKRSLGSESRSQSCEAKEP